MGPQRTIPNIVSCSCQPHTIYCSSASAAARSKLCPGTEFSRGLGAVVEDGRVNGERVEVVEEQ